MPKAASIPFIVKSASRTGAPTALLHMVRWIRAHSERRMGILLQTGGELAEDYARTAPTFALAGSSLDPAGWPGRVLRNAGMAGLHHCLQAAQLRRFAARTSIPVPLPVTMFLRRTRLRNTSLLPCDASVLFLRERMSCPCP